MIELLQSYSFAEIIIFFILICLAIKEGVTFYDWAKKRGQQAYDEGRAAEDEDKKIRKELDDLNRTFAEKEKKFDQKKEEINHNFETIAEQINALTKLVELLISSDKDDIKSYIVDKHHYFCYDKQWIDAYSLDCIERRFTHYKAEGGNSFVEDLMNEIRSLPKHPPHNK